MIEAVLNKLKIATYPNYQQTVPRKLASKGKNNVKKTTYRDHLGIVRFANMNELLDETRGRVNWLLFSFRRYDDFFLQHFPLGLDSFESLISVNLQ